MLLKFKPSTERTHASLPEHKLRSSSDIEHPRNRCAVALKLIAGLSAGAPGSRKVKERQLQETPHHAPVNVEDPAGPLSYSNLQRYFLTFFSASDL